MDWTSFAMGVTAMTWVGLIFVVIVAVMGRKK